MTRENVKMLHFLHPMFDYIEGSEKLVGREVRMVDVVANMNDPKFAVLAQRITSAKGIITCEYDDGFYTLKSGIYLLARYFSENKRTIPAKVTKTRKRYF